MNMDVCGKYHYGWAGSYQDLSLKSTNINLKRGNQQTNNNASSGTVKYQFKQLSKYIANNYWSTGAKII